MAYRVWSRLSFLFVFLPLVGCVTGTRNLTLDAVESTAQRKVDSTIAIGAPTDARIFEAAPRDPSTPSARGKRTDLSPAERARLIGRQRDSFGKAMGDLALAGDGTVQREVRRLLAEGLSSHGYRIDESGQARNRVEVVIEEFWAWFTPGMWSIGFEARIKTRLAFETASGRKEIDVFGYGRNRGQIESDANWVLAYHRAFADYLVNLSKALDEAGL